MVSPDFVEDRRVQRNVERSALSVEDHTRSLHRGVADTIALPRHHFREVLAPSLDIVVREASPFDDDCGTLTAPFRYFIYFRYSGQLLAIVSIPAHTLKKTFSKFFFFFIFAGQIRC